MKLKKIRKSSLSGKRVLLRLTMNTPMRGRFVENDFRLNRIVPTLKMLQESGAKTIVISHLGSDGSQSLRPIVRYLNMQHKGLDIGYVPDTDDMRRGSLLDNMKAGSIFVIENIRRYSEEKENDKDFAKELASFADIYINEDFAVSHREHASVVGVPKYIPSYVGPLFEEEVEELSRAFSPEHPFVIVLGGAKFKAKLPLVKKFLKKADDIFIVGALSNSFFKEMGLEVGKSLVDDKKIGLKTLAKDKKIHLPVDVMVKNAWGVSIKKPEEVTTRDTIVDVGPETVEMIKDYASRAKFILWNGPLGKFEEGFYKNTEEVAKAIAKSEAYSIVGGGDSISAIEKLDIYDSFDFVSTGGGAMLDFLAHKTLPGIEAIKKSKSK